MKVQYFRQKLNGQGTTSEATSVEENGICERNLLSVGSSWYEKSE